MATVSQAEFAAAIGKSRQYVHKLVKAGKLPVADDGNLDPDICKAVLAQMRDPARTLAAQNKGLAALLDDEPDDAVPATTYNQAALIHKLAQGQMMQLQLRKEAGELVEKAEVEREGFDCSRIVRDRMMALPQEVAGELVGMTDEAQIRLYLKNKIRDALMEASANVSEGG